MKKTVLILLAFLTLTSVFAQQSINDYKYIIVLKKFDFLKEADEFRLNSLTKFLFEKHNFEALMENDEVFPSDYSKNNCLALKANVLKQSTMFKTKLVVQLKNCKDEVIYTSSQGESREKNYKVAYNEALRNAFNSIAALNYSYNPKNTIKAKTNTKVVEVAQEELNKLKEEIKVLKKEKEVTVAQTKVKKDATLKAAKIKDNAVVLFAQEIANGFQLVDKFPKVIYKIKNTGLSNVFLVEDKNAILYKLDANWILEYYKNEILQTKIINIKF